MSLPLGSAHYCSKQRRSQCLEQSKASAVRYNLKKYIKCDIAFNSTDKLRSNYLAQQRKRIVVPLYLNIFLIVQHRSTFTERLANPY